MAGNVREWCANDDGSGRRYILGGGWADFAYAFTDRTAQRPLDRSPINGIRLVRYGGPPTPAQAAPVPRATRDLARERPASDAEYAAFRRLYDYDPQPVDARVLARDTTPADWVVERVALAAAYGAPGAPETLQALVFLPRRHPPPYRAVVLFPGSDAQFQRSGGESYGEHLGWLLRAGRALVLPIYKGTYERHDGLADQRTTATVAYRDLVLMWAKDLRRTIDYLGTRPDVDTTSLGYLGVSLGARMGGVMLAVEPRLRAGVLIAGGFSSRPMLPEVDPLHHLPRVRVPVLMLNGRYDDVFPLESAQRPFFAALGTAPAHKRLVLNDEGHYMPRTQAIVETLAWFDRYLGPPRR
jgi:dienelactone hydrolase